MNGKDKVLTILCNTHVGAGNGIGVRDLAKQCDMPERAVRACVTELREDGLGVCAHPRKGYFIAADEGELQAYCIAFLERRAMHSLSLVAKLRRLALPEYVGQLKLRT